MPKSYPKFYNLNSVPRMSRMSLENAMMAERGARYDDLKEMTDEEMVQDVITGRHATNGMLIERSRS